MPAKNNRLGFSSGAVARALVITCIAAALVTAAALVEGSAFVRQTHPLAIVLTATAPVDTWHVSQAGVDISGEPGARSWRGTALENGGPLAIAAKTRESGAIALRVEVSCQSHHSEQILWGEGAIEALIDPDAMHADEHHHE
jgi:hypothetical protein